MEEHESVLMVHLLHQAMEAFKKGDDTFYMIASENTKVSFTVVTNNEEKNQSFVLKGDMNYDTAVFLAVALLYHATKVESREKINEYLDGLLTRNPEFALEFINNSIDLIEKIDLDYERE